MIQLEKAKESKNDSSKKNIMSTIIFTTALVAFEATLFALVNICGSIKYIFEDTSFTIHSSFWKDRTVSYSDIEAVELRHKLKKGIRINGFGSAKLSLGLFRNKEFGNYQRYSYTKNDTQVVLRLKNNKILVIGGEDKATSEHIYDVIRMRKGRR